MRRMLFTTVAITAMLAAAPACHNTKPKIATPPAVENVRRADTMDNTRGNLQIIPKKVAETQTESAGGAQSERAANLQGIPTLKAGSLEKPKRAPVAPVGPGRKIPISD